MEFQFCVDNLLGDEITILDHDVKPFRKHADGYDYFSLRKQLFLLIDKMGEASAKAQGLHGTITTGRKLELSDHILYVSKDMSGQKPRGACVGILKIGRKKLFVYDRNGGQHEMNPLCVLDFYVHESRQRMGCGKKLFEFMLRDLGIRPNYLAIDKPSYKFSQFLLKHYNLRAVIPQVNNFVVFEGFFDQKAELSNEGRTGFWARPPVHPKSAYPNDVINYRGSNNSRTSSHHSRYHMDNSRPNSGHRMNIENSRPNSGQRYQNNSRPNSGSRKTDSRPGSGQLSSRAGQLTNRSEELNELGQLNLDMTGSNKENSAPSYRPLTTPMLNKNSSQRAYGAGANNYSRHSNTPPEGNNKAQAIMSSSRVGGGFGSRNMNQNQNYEPGPQHSPPLLRRDMHSATAAYVDQFNLHQDYQGRGGHLRLGMKHQAEKLPHINNNNNAYTPSFLKTKDHSWHNNRSDYSWTPGGPPSNHQTIGLRHYTHTRLW